MDKEKIQAILDQAIERLMDLRSTLSDHGKPLDRRERQMIRAALSTYVQEALDSALVDYMIGVSSESIIVNLASVLKDLEVL